ncbi:hypothetical protein WG902_18300 [Ramlibacter sp. PS3R-8]|uniref:hypothetical protein n=1 Tax=Ramlibacter sp. PS3R-8 TaxID=3133437 RepID=UPI00309F5270
MKQSFLSRIQSYFDGRYDGRYLEFVLAEIARRHPKAISELICSACGLPSRSLRAPVLIPEYRYESSGSRRADLAVFSCPEDSQPVVLIEIKYRDKPGRDQLPSYLKWKNGADGRNVLVLSREVLEPEGFAFMTWTRAARLLRAHAAGSEFVKALVEHLEEEGVVMQEIKPKPLMGFLKRILAPHAAGMQAGNVTGPEEFSRLLKNTKLLSARFNPLFKDAWRSAGKRGTSDPSGTKDASIDFDVINRLSVPTRAELYDESLGFPKLRDAVRAGGVIDVYARHSLGSGKDVWLRVGYGFWIEIKRSSSHEPSHHPTVHLWSWAYGAGVKRYNTRTGEDVDAPVQSSEKKISFALLTTKAEESIDRLEQIVRKQLVEVLEQLRSPSDILTAKQRLAVKHLLKRLRTA